MPWPNLTMQDLLDAESRLPPRYPNARPVRYPSGEVAFDVPVEKIVRFVIDGLIEWDDETKTLYLTPRAEHELRQRGL